MTYGLVKVYLAIFSFDFDIIDRSSFVIRGLRRKNACPTSAWG